MVISDELWADEQVIADAIGANAKQLATNQAKTRQNLIADHCIVELMLASALQIDRDECLVALSFLNDMKDVRIRSSPK